MFKFLYYVVIVLGVYYLVKLFFLKILNNNFNQNGKIYKNRDKEQTITYKEKKTTNNNGSEIIEFEEE